MSKNGPHRLEITFGMCVYALNNVTLKAKGLEGFRNHGVEVVESVVKSPYHWKNADQGCMSVSERRDVGDNANSEFYWKVSDYGCSVFPTKEEAAVLKERMTWIMAY